MNMSKTEQVKKLMTDAGIASVVMGNKGDTGFYHGQTVRCLLFGIEDNQERHIFRVLVMPVGDLGTLGVASYCPHLVEEGSLEVPLYCTNARALSGKEGDFESAMESMDFDPSFLF